MVRLLGKKVCTVAAEKIRITGASGCALAHSPIARFEIDPRSRICKKHAADAPRRTWNLTT